MPDIAYAAFCALIGVISYHFGARSGSKRQRPRSPRVPVQSEFRSLNSSMSGTRRSEGKRKPVVRDDSAAYEREIEERHGHKGQFESDISFS